MMPPGHVAVTWGVARLVQQKDSPPPDYRLLAGAALLPDVIDKPLAILVFTEANTSQLLAHSLLVGAAVVVLALLFWRGAVPYALAFGGHFLLDRMWNHTESFWWPFYGWTTFWAYKPMGSPGEMLTVYLDILTRYPQVWVVEVLAVGYLAWFAYRHGLYRWAGLKRFMLSGWLRLESKLLILPSRGES